MTMTCPYCSSTSSQVEETRDNDKGVRRRRKCVRCRETFSTLEQVWETPPKKAPVKAKPSPAPTVSSVQKRLSARRRVEDMRIDKEVCD